MGGESYLRFEGVNGYQHGGGTVGRDVVLSFLVTGGMSPCMTRLNSSLLGVRDWGWDCCYFGAVTGSG